MAFDTSYYQDQAISEQGALYKVGDAVSTFGKFFASLSIIGFGLKTASWFAGVVSPFPVVGGVIAAGGAAKGISEIANGRVTKGVKEIIKGAVEGVVAWQVPAMALTALATGGAAIPLLIAAAEVFSLIKTKKSMVSNVGDVVGNVLDSVLGIESPAELDGQNQQPAQVASMDGMGMGMQPAMQPTMAMPQPMMGQPMMMPPQQMMGGMVGAGAYTNTAIPAAVGMTAPMMAQEQPANEWQEKVGGSSEKRMANIEKISRTEKPKLYQEAVSNPEASGEFVENYR